MEQSLLPVDDGGNNVVAIRSPRYARERRRRGLPKIIPVPLHHGKGRIRRGEGLQLASRLRPVPLQRPERGDRRRYRCRSYALGTRRRIARRHTAHLTRLHKRPVNLIFLFTILKNVAFDRFRALALS